MKHDVDGGARHTSDWSQWTVEHMWRVLWNEDPERTSRHGGAWYNVMDACARHRDRLRAFRDQLLQRWSGPAADAYLAKLDQLIKGLDETTEAAFNTYRALSTMADAIATARQQMTPLYAQWQRYEQEERDLRDQWWVVQAIRGNPVTPEEREALNRPARAIMNVASDAIFQSYLTMTPAPPYEPPLPGQGSAEEVGDDDVTVGRPVPPLRPQRPPSIPTPRVDRSHDDSVLNGMPTPTGLPDTTPQSAGSASSLPANSQDSQSVVGPTSVGGRPLVIAPRAPAGASPTSSIPGTPRTTAAHSLPSVPPPVIGARPGSGWAPATPVAASPGGRRSSPAGGIIGSTGSGKLRQPATQWIHSDNEQFLVDTGHAVPPVLEPSPEPSFDSGPAIGAAQ